MIQSNRLEINAWEKHVNMTQDSNKNLVALPLVLSFIWNYKKIYKFAQLKIPS